MNLASPHPPNGAALRLIATGDSPSDDALLDRIDERDTAAFALFYDRHCGAAYGLACRILGETEAACVAMEEGFMQVWREPRRRGRVRETARASLLLCVNRCAFTIHARACRRLGCVQGRPDRARDRAAASHSSPSPSTPIALYRDRS